jgi:tungstate transport system substrate-binding protein
MDPHSTTARPPARTGLRRRDLGAALAGVAAAAALPAVAGSRPAAATTADPTTGGPTTLVRLGTVGATQTGGMLGGLLAGFQQQTRYQVQVTAGNAADLYAQARLGEFDLVTTHFGLDALRDAVADRVGRWPQLLFSTAFAVIASPDDPAGVRGAADAVGAFTRIADSRSPFVVNDLDNPRFVVETLWHAAGQPDREGWYHDTGLRGPAAVREASALGGYTLWGLHPFLAFQQQGTDMRAVLFGDSLLQQTVASVAVQPGPGRRVNIAGALALQRHLTSPETQGLIRRFRHPRFDQPIFWPAAHLNAPG